MNDEIVALRGRLAVAEKTLELLTVNIDCDISIIRGYADKYEPKATLQSGHILATAQRIHEQATKYRDLAETAARIKRDLGEE
jgi:hypothetical protein